MTQSNDNVADIRTQTVDCWKVTGPNQLSRTTYELPAEPSEGQVELTPIFVGVCGSDTELIAKGGAHSSHSGTIEPIIPGHEPVARVARVGKEVTRVKVGDVVAVEPAYPCDNCVECESGRYHTCRRTKYMATPPTNGCFAQRIHWPARFCHRVPAALHDRLDMVALTEPLAACMQAVSLRKQYVKKDRKFEEFEAIIGGGAMAMGVLALRKAVSPDNQVIVFARNKSDLEFATKLGADKVFQLSNHKEDDSERRAENVAVFQKARRECGERICAAYECTGQERVLEAAIESRFLRGEGSFIGLGCHYNIHFDKAALRRDECSLVPVRRSKDKFPTVLDVVSKHIDVFERLIGSIVKFDELPQILTRRGGKPTGTGGPKVVVQF